MWKSEGARHARGAEIGSLAYRDPIAKDAVRDVAKRRGASPPPTFLPTSSLP